MCVNREMEFLCEVCLSPRIQQATNIHFSLHQCEKGVADILLLVYLIYTFDQIVQNSILNHLTILNSVRSVNTK